VAGALRLVEARAERLVPHIGQLRRHIDRRHQFHPQLVRRGGERGGAV
jgi:hypothetical protein